MGKSENGFLNFTRQADKKARELADAQRTIEEYLRQEQSRDQHQKRKRNDLE